MQQSRRSLIALLAAVLLLATACQQQVVYHHYVHISDTGWGKNDGVYFSIPPVAKAGNYQEEVELRIDKTYPFQRLTLLVEQTVYPLGRHEHYVLDCDLIDKRGSIRGDGISYFNYRLPVGNVILGKGDSLSIRISHNMKRETMPGIADIGVRLSGVH